MISVEHLYDHDTFKKLLEHHFPLEKFVKQNNIVRLTDGIISCLAEKNFFSAKELITLTIASEDSCIESLFGINQQLVDEFKEQINVNNDFYVFSGTKSAFALVFDLQKLSPSVNQFIIAAYEMLSSIKFVGSGKGSFVIIKPILDLTLKSFKSIVASRIDFHSNGKNLKHMFRVLKQDALYYEDIVNFYEQEIVRLNDLILKLNHDQYMSTQMTWR